MTNTKPLVYSCSGCMHLATMAHDIALTLDSDGIAEMSCISSLLAATPTQAQEKTANRKIILIEACNENCTTECLDKVGVKVDHYFNLADLGFFPRSASDGSLQENSIAMSHIYGVLEKSGIIAV